MRIQIASLLITAALFGCASAPESRKLLTVEELLGHSDEYDNKPVSVIGYASYGFESCILLPLGASGTNPHNSLDLSLWYWDESCMRETRHPKQGIAVLHGTFRKQDKGHLGSYAASLVVSKIDWQ
jgi:hypothetical protein